MKILYVAMKYDYGRPEQGFSFEHHNFFDALLNMGHEILYFDFMTLLRALGRDGMNQRLFDVARSEKPDLMFSVLFTDELDPRVVRRISKRTQAVTLNWFADDHWRFDTFSRHWAPNFNWVVTTASSAIPKYKAIRYRNAIKSQWACNHFLYRKLDVAARYDVSFVGQPHGDRRQVIDLLRSAGVDVQVWGQGWEAGRLSQEEMIRVFNESRINLNLSNASRPAARMPSARQRLSGSLEQRSLGRIVKRPVRPLVRAGRRVLSRSRPPTPSTVPEQIKGRNFEVPGCGGFLLTSRVAELDRYYVVGREIACFDSPGDLVEQIRHYLEHHEERTKVAAAGYERTLREHTYAHRFDEIFRHIGLADRTAGPEGRRGEVLEIA